MGEEMTVSRDRRAQAQLVWKIVKRVLLYAFMVLLAAYMLLPFYWSLLTSFRTQAEATTLPIKLYPTAFSGENYKFFFEKIPVMDYIGNTFFVIAVVLLCQLLLCALGGYSLAKLEYRGKGILMKLMYASMMIPGVICLVPQYIVVMELGLVESLWGIIVPAMYSIYGVLFMRSFFLSTPTEIAEAARIDGAGELRIFGQLFVPMVLPGIMTLALFTFNSNWNSYLWPSLIVSTVKESWVMAVAIKEFESLYIDTNMGAIMAGSIITILPSVLIFLFGQKYFMENLSFAGIK